MSQAKVAAAVFDRLLRDRLDFAFRVADAFYLLSVETITYSQFKGLTKKGLLSNVVIGEKTIHGDITPSADNPPRNTAKRRHASSTKRSSDY